MNARLALAPVLVLWTLGCGEPDSAPNRFVRAVVGQHTLSLTNTQQDPVTWPLWGGAFALGELSIRATLTATGASGLLIAGPEQQDVAVELISGGAVWTLRERSSGQPVQERTGALASDGALVIELTPATVRAVGALGELALDLTAPLGPEGAAAGLYVTLEPGASLVIEELALTAPLPSHPELGTPLRELAVARGVDIGTAFDIWPPQHDLALESLLGEQFSRLAPTDFYWATTRGEDQDFFFVPADLAVNYALVHEQALTGMFLIWDYALPEWVLELHGRGDVEALDDVFEQHITATVERYAGRVDAWVVVNEAIWGLADVDEPAQLAQTIWYDALGPEYIERAFELARAADPDAALLYNETGAEGLNDKSDFMFAMAQDFVNRGVPIDGVGLQFHVHAGSPPVLADVQANMQRFGELGLAVHITELDVSLEGLEMPEEQARELQAQIYADVLEVCLAVPACENWTVFGLSDRYAWDELGDARPLLFDAAYQPKPAFFAVQETLR